MLRHLVLGANSFVLSYADPRHHEVVLIESKDRFNIKQITVPNRIFLFESLSLELLLPIIRAEHAVKPFDQVITPRDKMLVLAEELNASLKLPGAGDKVARLFYNKPLLRERLNKANFSPVQTQLGTTIADIKHSLKFFAKPLIVKPTDQEGSLGVFKINPGAPQAEMEHIINTYEKLNIKNFLIEELLIGPEFSVESFSVDKRHLIITVTEKLTNDYFVELGHVIPAPLPEKTRREIEVFTKEFLDISGVINGPCCTEIRLTNKGPAIIESQNRPGGDGLPELMEHAFGFKIFEKMYELPNLKQGNWPPKLTQKCTAAIRYFNTPPGRIKSISFKKEPRQIEGVVDFDLSVKPGDFIKPIRSSDDRIGYAMAIGRTAEEAVARCNEAISSVDISLQNTGL